MGTTSQKLQYLTTTKSNIKDAINLTGANILSEDTFRSYANKLKQGLVDAINDGGSTIYSNFPKTTGEGTEITLNNTYAAPMRTTLKGNTEQDTLTGKNLLDTTIYNSTANVTILDKNNGVLDLEGVSGYYEGVSQSFDVTPNQNYVLSYNAQLIDTSVASACYVRIREKDDSTVIATNYNSGNQTISFTPTTDEINVFFRVNGETNKGHTKYSNIQLEQGTSKTSFEPYVGGIPSPNPDYPQPVKVVTGNNTINVCGKNLFDGIFRQGNRYTTGLTDTTRLFSTQNYPVKSGVIYTISTTLNTSVYKYAINLSTQIYPIPNTAEGNARQYYDSGWKQTNTFTFTPIKDGYLGIVVAKLNGTDTLTPSDISSSTWQLEVGSTATAYQPYQGSNYPINLGSIELCKIGDYQDYIYKENNKWYKHSEIGKVVLDGSESWDNFKVEATGLGRAIGIGSNVLYQDNQATLLSNKLVGVKYSGSWNNTFECITTMSSNRFIAYLKNVSNLTEFTTKLASGYEFYYVLATPTNTEITDTDLIGQLEELEKAKSVDGKTFISQINEQLPFILDVSALSKN